MSKKTKEEKSDYTGTIQNLLYSFPLYNYVNKDKVNILVFGYSDISEKFIDFAFEMAQVNGYKLCITVVSDDADAKENHLKSRPAFCKFFNVDDKTADDSYGTLLFNTTSFGNIEDDISKLMLNDDSDKYAYLFIGTDDDSFNSVVADICSDCRELLDSNFIINCVANTNSNNENKNESINYVYRNDSIVNHKDYKTLKSMAFNCHLVWEYSKLLDMRKLLRQFSADYYYVSCLSYCISIKYKLASIGIDFLDADAPEKFDSLLKSNVSCNKKVIEDMIANEHRRWNVNMICRGYKPAESLEKYVNGTESRAKKYHPCLVKGTGVQGLNDEWNKNDHAKWDNYSNKDLSSLDELDKVSVLLHGEYKKHANRVKRENIILQSDIDIIYKLLGGYTEAKIAFDKYYICIQEISAGNNAKTTLYEHYYSTLNKALNNLPKDQAKIVKRRINTLAASFNAILESEKYIDYKQYDIDLIYKIPFILTYKSNLHIGIPVDAANVRSVVNTDAFKLVESALIINPSRITYICDFERRDLNNLVRILEYAIKSMDSHHLRSAINICLLTNCSLSEQDESKIESISNRIHSVEIIMNENEFIEYSKKRHIKIFEFNRTRTSSIIERYNCCQSNYKYNRDTNEFVTTNCNEIKYIFFQPVLKISDIFEFKNSIDDYRFPDMKRDYDYFWNLYKGKSDSEKRNGFEKRWKALCDLLGEQDKTNEIEIKNIRGENIKKTYLVEKPCLDSLKKLCKQAKKANEAISCYVEIYSNSSYNLTVNAPSGFHETLFNLLCNAYKLYDSNSINIRVYKETLYLYYNSLSTGNISASTVKKIIEPMNVSFAEIKLLLEEINTKGYIRNLCISEANSISFSYCTHQVKEVMTMSGRILELFVYYKLLETGRFDDIANSVEIHWGEDEAENEIDIIATKGYKVLIIECKAKTALSQNFYNKLSRLDSDYGLNSVPVIVADTLETKRHAEENAKMMEIGNRVGIHTVYKKNDISDIGNTLENIIKNN